MARSSDENLGGCVLIIVERKTTQAVKATTPHNNKGKGATLVPSAVKLLHRKEERKNQWGSGGLQAWPETGSW